MSTAMPVGITQMDPLAGYLANQKRIDAAVLGVMRSGFYILGSEVQAFEREFAAYLGVAEIVGVANGTDAIELALRVCEVGADDIVVTVSHTAVATVAAIRRCGAVPALVDISESTYTMDPQSLESGLRFLDGKGKQAKAIIVVHLYGCPAEMDAILEIARRYDVPVIEDCAQAHGAEYHGRKVGTMGRLAGFSFYPTKNLGAIGDGGAVVTNDRVIGEQLRSLRQYGWRQRYVSECDGINSRLDEMQAAILRVQLQSLNDNNLRRCQIAAVYRERFQDLNLVLPVVPAQCTHVFHQFVLQVPCREAFRDQLAKAGVGTTIHYPLAVHQQAPYCNCAITGLENTESVLPKLVSLPMYPQLGPEQIGRVCDAVRKAAAGNV